MSSTLTLYERFTKYPLGSVIFSKGVGFRAPYFSTIHPRVMQLRPGYCSVEIKERRSIRNHIGTIHAGALCTLSDLVGGLALEATIPSSLRWIPKEMTVQYIKKAKGKLVGECSVDPGVLTPGDISVPLKIKDEKEETVLNAMIVFHISERKPTN